MLPISMGSTPGWLVPTPRGYYGMRVLQLDLLQHIGMSYHTKAVVVEDIFIKAPQDDSTHGCTFWYPWSVTPPTSTRGDFQP